MRSRSTLDWSQSKIFLVLTLIIFGRLMLMAKTTKLCKAHLFFLPHLMYFNALQCET